MLQSACEPVDSHAFAASLTRRGEWRPGFLPNVADSRLSDRLAFRRICLS